MKGRSTTESAVAVPQSYDARPPGNNPPSGLGAPQHSKPMPATTLPSSRDPESTRSNDVNDQRQKAIRTRPKPMVARRPVTRSRKKSMDSPTEAPGESQQPRPQISNISQLAQGVNHIKTYYNDSHEVFKRLNLNETQLEVDFVSAFISGITDPKMRNRLIAELQQLHPSRNRKDGRIEVLCDWHDIPEGLRKAGLLSPAMETSRRKHRILGDLSDLGF